MIAKTTKEFLMSRTTVAVELKTGFTIKCGNEASYKKIHALLVGLGYTKDQEAYVASFPYITTVGGFPQVTQTHHRSYDHFDDVMDFAIWVLDAEWELKKAIEEKQEEFDKIESELKALKEQLVA